MILIIDNYDSFTYNLVQYLGEILLTRGLNPDAEIKVVRNDELSVEALVNLYPHYLVVSPGPCTPRQAGISVEAIKQLAGKIPILGVCLGHQSIGAAFGGEIIRAKTIMHGKTSAIYHNGINLFKNLPNPFIATRYHSLVIKKENIPAVSQSPIKVFYEDEIIGEYFADIFVDDKVIVEIKAAKGLALENEAQLLNYLKATDIEVGLLLNFGTKPEIKRKVFDNDRK